MGNQFTSRFNSALGSNITHIANAYSQAESVVAIFHCKQLTLTSAQINFALCQNSTNVTVEQEDITEYVQIPFNTVHKKYRDTHVEFLTIVAQTSTETPVIPVRNYKIMANHSFILTDKGEFIRSVYGGSVWLDNDGNVHKV